jgi:hypothetical protein
MDSAAPRESMTSFDSAETPETNMTKDNDDGGAGGHHYHSTPSARTPSTAFGSSSTWKSPARITRSAAAKAPPIMTPPPPNAPDARSFQPPFVGANFNGNGTCENPYVFMVDFDYPYNHGGFEIFFVSNKPINDHLRDIVHIRRQADKEPERYKCYLPSVKDTDQHMLKRVVVCEVPKIPYDHREYHSLWCEEFGCDVTTQAISAQRLKFKGDQTYYKFIFPDGIKFDNHVMSNNPTEVEKKTLLTGEDYDANDVEALASDKRP